MKKADWQAIGIGALILLVISMALLVIWEAGTKGSGTVNAEVTPINIVVRLPDGGLDGWQQVTVDDDPETRILRVYREGRQVGTYLPTAYVAWHVDPVNPPK